jgi:hypothetical protein
MRRKAKSKASLPEPGELRGTSQYAVIYARYNTEITFGSLLRGESRPLDDEPIIVISSMPRIGPTKGHTFTFVYLVGVTGVGWTSMSEVPTLHMKIDV